MQNNQLLINFAEATNTQQRPTSAMSWVTYAILGGILVILVGYIIFKIIKHFVDKKREVRKRIKRIEVNKEVYREYVVTINEIIDYSLEELDKFQVSVGQRKMSELKNGAAKLLQVLYEREDFKDFKESEKYQYFVKALVTLNNTSLNTWHKKCQEEMNYFKQLQTELIDDDVLKTYRQNAKQSIREKFYDDEDLELEEANDGKQ
ncbi:MHJ_0274 family protein [Mycoplasma sp. 128]|uniref:MHJ_0274 family protein n=1 Tax=Mycoplasma sp. 3341 TaxID=3447506 RepID=UPI003F654E3E